MLIPNWRRVVRKAWSFRLALLSAVLAGVEMALPLFSDSVPPHIFLSLSVLTSVGSVLARLVAQPRMHDDAR